MREQGFSQAHIYVHVQIHVSLWAQEIQLMNLGPDPKSTEVNGQVLVSIGNGVYETECLAQHFLKILGQKLALGQLIKRESQRCVTTFFTSVYIHMTHNY